MKKTYVAVSLMLLALWLGCTKATFVQEDLDCDERITYDEHMEPIIAEYCSYSGCHDGNSSDAKDYRTYNDISADFATMFDRVVTQVSNPFTGMPRDDGSGLNDLTDEHFLLFSCWIEQEFPEN